MTVALLARGEGRPEPLDARLAPMLATPGPLPEGAGWAYEFKWDGVRALVAVGGPKVVVTSRRGNEVSVSYPELAVLGDDLAGHRVLLDGEIVALGPHGRPDFARLQRRMHVGDPAAAARLAHTTPVCFLAFDVLHVDGRSTRELPYRRRREVLESLPALERNAAVPPSFPGPGQAVLDAARDQGLEGVVAKQVEATYLPGRRSRAWVKVKLVRHQEVVVGGWRPGGGRREGKIGSLLLGVPESGRLRYAGHVGTGFTEAVLADLRSRLEPLVTDRPPFDPPPPPADARDAVWVRPEVVGEVGYSEWTPDGRLRHPTWRGLRPDKLPAEVRRED